MKILYDYQTFETQRFGGISRYYYELIKNFGENKIWGIEWDLPIHYSNNGYVSKLPQIQINLKGEADYYKRFAWGYEFKGKWFLYQKFKQYFPKNFLQNQQLSVKYLKQGGYDIFHPTDIHDYFLEYVNNKKLVITIHDMIDELYPEYSFHVYSEYNTSVKKKMIEKADKIIAVSQSTKQDIIDFYKTPEDKIEVIYHGNSLNSIQDFSKFKDVRLPAKYLLFVGKRVHYKNFYFFLQVVAPFLYEDADLHIICVGSSFEQKEDCFFQQLNISDRVLHLKADDQVLAYLYQNALAFVYPSLYEGFGIPILEAFACNCPVILSNCSSFPEVAGDAGIYFDPKNITSFRDALHCVLFDSKERDNLVAKGLKQLEKFSWYKSAQKTAKLYQDVLH